MEERAVVSNKNGSPNGILITVDETGGLKGNTENRCYCIVATMVNNRFAFADVIKDFGFSKEAGFAKDPMIREQVITRLCPYMDRVVYVFACRPAQYEWARKPKEVHAELLMCLKECLNDMTTGPTLIMVDNNESLIPDETVKGIFYPKSRRPRNCYCVVLPSVYFFELQAHDFITGAIGYWVNRHDRKYAYILTANGVPIFGKQVSLPMKRRRVRLKTGLFAVDT